jgi:glycosyltransferase involved in cell wall biosynthesis
VFAATSGPPCSDATRAGLGFLQALGVECAGANGAATEDVIRAAAARGLSVVYLHRLATASAYGGLARQYAPNAQVIFSVADLHHLRLARQAEVTRRPDLAAKARAVKAAEFWTMQMADCVITHSRFEANYLRNAAPHINVHVVPWAVATSAPLGAGHKREHIAFIGGANHAPNVDAVLHLAQDIMPLVWRRKPLIRCLIAGEGWAENFFSKLDLRIVNLGHQTSLTPLLRLVKLTVAPLRFGAGIKGKVLESMAAGTPCAMSELAAEGLNLDGALQECTGNGADMADNILALYNNKKRARIAAQSGLDMVETDFSAAATRTAMANALGLRTILADRSEASPSLRA